MHCGSKPLFFIIFLFTINTCLAQVTPVYTFQKDDTVVKRTYYNEALKKKTSLKASLPKENTKEYEQAYNEMFATVEDLLLSSRSVTEKTADDYIKKIAARIIAANPELKELDTRIVFSRDFSPNAFSIGDGTISFNAGLFVYLENEAQMAFIVCHELAHYYLDHSRKRLNRYIQIANSDSLKKEMKKLSKQEYRVGEQFKRLLKQFVFDARKHSRDNEEEADKIGLHFLKNSGYNGNGFITAMQLLDKADDTALFAPVTISKVLSFPGYPFKERWIKKESAIFGSMNPDEAEELSKKEKDSLKTHPDCSRRILLLQDSALSIAGKYFQEDEKLFRQLKQEFLPELVEEVYRNNNISYNLYLCLQMLQEGKYIPLAVYSIARNLNKLYQYQKNHGMGLVVDSENRRFSDGYNLLLRMLYRLRLNEIAELNTAFCLQYQEQMKGYKEFTDEMEKAINNKQSHQ